ncbi:MAG: HAD-IA family hydrolase [Deltaproteobacteria bacterium]|nr:HAD-IA family hydrolase [Deltaproteobacteria bacterium]
MVVKDIIFDLGNVLVPFDWRIAVTGLIKYLPGDLAAKSESDPKLFALVVSDLIEALEIGSISFEGFHREIVLRTDLSADLLEFRRIWCDIFRLDHQMVNLGRELARRYGVWLASNTDEAHYEYIIGKFPELLFYKKAALSYKMGTKKPQRQYFIKALEMFQIKAKNSIFIDDIMENVQAAGKLGMVGIQFTTFESLSERLREYGVVT